MKGDYENFTYAEVSGSEPQKTANTLAQRTQQIRKKRDSLMSHYRELRRKENNQEEMSTIIPEIKNRVELLEFTVDKDKAAIEKAVEKDGIEWTTMATSEGMDGEIPVHYQIRGVPTFFIINPDGEIVDKFMGYRENKIEEIKKIAAKE